MQKLTAVILSSRNIGEYDRLYSLYTKEAGILKAIGKGVRKQAAKLAGHLEPATLSEVYVARSRGIGQITSAITLEGFENLKKNFEKLQQVLKIFQFFSRNFAEGERDERIFNLLEEFLEFWEIRRLAEKNWENKEKILIEAFWWKLFDFLGNRPEIMKCAQCTEKLEEREKKFFSSARGGIICKKCFAGEGELNEIASNQIKLLRVFLANPLSKILKVKAGKGELDKLGRIRETFERYNF